MRDGAFHGIRGGEAGVSFLRGCLTWPMWRPRRKSSGRAVEGGLTLTPPPKPVFEEKLALALLWNGHLGSFWRQEMGEGFFKTASSPLFRAPG